MLYQLTAVSRHFEGAGIKTDQVAVSYQSQVSDACYWGHFIIVLVTVHRHLHFYFACGRLFEPRDNLQELAIKPSYRFSKFRPLFSFVKHIKHPGKFNFVRFRQFCCQWLKLYENAW